MNPSRPPVLTIVVPCYNEQEVLPETARRLGDLLARMVAGRQADAGSHVLFVDDGSRDATWAQIADLHRVDPRFRGLKLSANRGHQIALIAGLSEAVGDVVVSVDADLQDDLEVMSRMLDEHEAGADVVYGVRADRGTDTVFKRMTAEMYYRLLKRLGVRVVFNHADYRLLSRRALEALKQFTEVNLFLRGLVPLIGYRSVTVQYERHERFAGESKYPLRKMLSLAADGVTSFSVVPLRVISMAGILFSVVSILLAAWVIWVKYFVAGVVPGWASSVIPIYFIGGVQLLSLGVIGEYVAKIYFETKRRPRYFVEESLK